MMNKDDLIKKHRIVKITSIILMISGFFTYFFATIITLRALGFLRVSEFIAIFLIFTLPSYWLLSYLLPTPTYTFLSYILPPLFSILIYIFFPFIFTFAIYKTIFPLTRKSMLTLMDENALLQNLKMIRDKFSNLFLIFFLFAPLIPIILIIVVYLYLAVILKYYNTQPTIESFKS